MVKYIKFSVNAKLSNTPPPFIGSMIRGAMGGSLKEIVCINPTLDCKDCFAKENCLFYEFYEEKNRFLNYRLDFNLNQKTLKFDYYLFNEATSKYPYILSAIEKLFTKKGLGVKRETTNNFKIYNEDKLIYNGNNFSNIKIEPTIYSSHSELVSESKTPTIIKLKLITPLRLKKNGRFLKPDTLDVKDILISIIGKKAFYENQEKKRIEHFPQIVMKDLKFLDLTRYSNRQKTKMKVGGIVGEMVINNLTPQTYNLLKYGEITGVGKLNSFGLGKIEVEEL